MNGEFEEFKLLLERISHLSSIRSLDKKIRAAKKELNELYKQRNTHKKLYEEATKKSKKLG